MRTLFIARQDADRRSWHPVGRLSFDGELYRFVYTRGVEQVPGFVPFGRMTNLETEYVSEGLFPLFLNRVLPESRPEYPHLLEWLDLQDEQHDTLTLLALTEGLRRTDSLEVFPKPEPREPGHRLEVRFLVHGIRHFPDFAQRRVNDLTPGDLLYLLPDPQNDAHSLAVAVRMADPPTLIGYVPRYLAADLRELLAAEDTAAELRVTVRKVNLDAPYQLRLLCQASSPWPVSFRPCEGEEFQPVGAARAQRTT